MIKNSQNFLNNKEVIEKCLSHTHFPEEELVIEIGGGKGIITRELVKRFNKILVFELDIKLFKNLQDMFNGILKLKVFHKNFLEWELPKENFNIFSNIPFNITSDIIKKITNHDSKLNQAYLIMQKEAIQKYVSINKKNSETSLLSILIQIRYSIDFLMEINRKNFNPTPNFDAGLISFRRKDYYDFVSKNEENVFMDFICFLFNRSKPFILESFKDLLPKDLALQLLLKNKIDYKKRIKSVSYEEWLKLFKEINFPSNQKILILINGSYQKMIRSQIGINKIHRTRKY